jgi:hypothetical protein
MKYLYLLATIAILLSSGGCALINDTPRHTADEVTTIAQSFSPQCQKLLIEAPSTSHG